MELIYPNTITVLTTYKCTAACKECCFECSPKINGRVSLETMKQFIKESKSFLGEHLKAVVFTGGECFLLKEDLTEAIRFAKENNLLSRCVSNGYWATTEEKAYQILKGMKEAGLHELNISTGDNHQEFVPFERVLNATIAASKLEMNALIVVEGHKLSKFKYRDVIENERFQQYKRHHETASNLSVMNNIWIPFHENTNIEQEEKLVKSPDRLEEFMGCDNILTTFGINPYNEIVGCCGLTMEYIPEMKLGHYETGKLSEQFYNQFNDFMKIWLWVEGPEKLLYFASTKDSSIKFSDITHNCQACIRVFKDEKVKNVLAEHWQEVVNEVMFKYAIKQKTFTIESNFI